jgi:hypothetical protein
MYVFYPSIFILVFFPLSDFLLLFSSYFHISTPRWCLPISFFHGCKVYVFSYSTISGGPSYSYLFTPIPNPLLKKKIVMVTLHLKKEWLAIVTESLHINLGGGFNNSLHFLLKSRSFVTILMTKKWEHLWELLIGFHFQSILSVFLEPAGSTYTFSTFW